jgi:hypothetical protein
MNYSAAEATKLPKVGRKQQQQGNFKSCRNSFLKRESGIFLKRDKRA